MLGDALLKGFVLRTSYIPNVVLRILLASLLQPLAGGGAELADA
jgi:hypothetical protein